LLFVVSLFIVVCHESIVVVCRKSIYYYCLSLFRVVLDYEVLKSYNEGARTKVLMKLIV
jgi:hypothetical protein